MDISAEGEKTTVVVGDIMWDGKSSIVSRAHSTDDWPGPQTQHSHRLVM